MQGKGVLGVQPQAIHERLLAAIPKALRTSVICVSAIVGALAFASAAQAKNDNVTPFSWHPQDVTYQLNSGLPSDWKNAINGAAATWSAHDAANALKYHQGSETGSTDYRPTDTHIVWRAPIPAEFQEGCPPANTLACTNLEYHYQFVGDDSGGQYIGDMDDADTVFNSDQPFDTSRLDTCDFPVYYDVQTVALHEFGHWAYLEHTSYEPSVMFPSYEGCRRDLTSFDVTSMNQQYGGG